MRFMIIVRATPDTEAGIFPADDTLMAAMASYHEALAQAGVLLDAAGLQPSAKGWRIHHGRDGSRRVVDGPFAEAKELIAGYTLIQVRDEAEARAWASRFPMPFVGIACEIEVRRLYEDADFAPGGDMAIRAE